MTILAERGAVYNISTATISSNVVATATLSLLKGTDNLLSTTDVISITANTQCRFAMDASAPTVNVLIGASETRFFKVEGNIGTNFSPCIMQNDGRADKISVQLIEFKG